MKLDPLPAGFEPATADEWFISPVTGETILYDRASVARRVHYRDRRRRLFIIIGPVEGQVHFGVYRAIDSIYAPRCLFLGKTEAELRAWLTANPKKR